MFLTELPIGMMVHSPWSNDLLTLRRPREWQLSPLAWLEPMSPQHDELF